MSRTSRAQRVSLRQHAEPSASAERSRSKSDPPYRERDTLPLQVSVNFGGVLIWAARSLISAGALIACGRGGGHATTPAVERPERANRAVSSGSSATPSSSSGPAVLGRCSASSCDYARATCCESEIGGKMTGCVSKAARPDARLSEKAHKCYGERADDWIGIECLSSRDCPNGLRCCSAVTSQPLNYCTTECEEHEACAPEGPTTCPPGFRCKPESSSRSGGLCVVAAPGVACGNLRCSGEKAGCRYDVDTKIAECVALTPDGSWPMEFARPLTDHSALLECASKKDCGHERCCTRGVWIQSACSGMCMSGIDVCDSLADCPEFIGPPRRCAPAPEGPPFLKVCQYGGPP